MNKLMLLLCCVTFGTSFRTSLREYTFFHVIKDGETTLMVPEAEGSFLLCQNFLAERILKITNYFDTFIGIREVLGRLLKSKVMFDTVTWNKIQQSTNNSIWDIFFQENFIFRTQLKSFNYPEFEPFLIKAARKRERSYKQMEQDLYRSYYPLGALTDYTLQLKLVNQIVQLQNESILKERNISINSKDILQALKNNNITRVPPEWLYYRTRVRNAYVEIVDTSQDFVYQGQFHNVKLLDYLMTQLSNFNTYIREIHTFLHLSSIVLKISNSDSKVKLNTHTTNIIKHFLGFEHIDIIYGEKIQNHAGTLKVRLSVQKRIFLNLKHLVPKFDMRYFVNTIKIGGVAHEHFAVHKDTVHALTKETYFEAIKTNIIETRDLIKINQEKCQAHVLRTGYESTCEYLGVKVPIERTECRVKFCLLSNTDCPKNITTKWDEYGSVCTMTLATKPVQTTLFSSFKERYKNNIENGRREFLKI